MSEQTSKPIQSSQVAHELSKNESISKWTDYWEDFFLSIIFVLILPLVPFIIELWRNGQVATAELMLTASMYAISVGLSSSSRLMFGITLIMGLLFGMAYGWEKGQNGPMPSSNLIGYASVTIVFVVHVLERVNTHFVKQTRWDFPGAKRK